jgi:hypothetical protein
VLESNNNTKPNQKAQRVSNHPGSVSARQRRLKARHQAVAPANQHHQIE